MSASAKNISRCGEAQPGAGHRREEKGGASATLSGGHTNGISRGLLSSLLAQNQEMKAPAPGQLLSEAWDTCPGCVLPPSLLVRPGNWERRRLGALSVAGFLELESLGFSC